MSQPQWDPDVVMVDGPEQFPALRRSDVHNVLHGYVVRGSGAMDPTPWMWFTALEPAYVYGRALRMAGPISSWDLNRAALNTRYDPSSPWLARRTLYIESSPATDRFTRDVELLDAFHDGVSRDSAHWVQGTPVNFHRSATSSTTGESWTDQVRREAEAEWEEANRAD